MAPDLLRDPQNGRDGCPAQLQIRVGRDQILSRPRRGRRPRLRSRVHRARRGDRRRHLSQPPSHLRRQRLPVVRGRLLRYDRRMSEHVPRSRTHRGRRRGDLLLVRYDRIPEGDSARSPLSDPFLPRRAGAPRSDERRRVPLHPAALSHRREDALVRQPSLRLPRRDPQGHVSRDYPPRRVRRALHDRLAPRSVGAGHFRRARPRRTQTFRSTFRDGV